VTYVNMCAVMEDSKLNFAGKTNTQMLKLVFIQKTLKKRLFEKKNFFHWKCWVVCETSTWTIQGC